MAEAILKNILASKGRNDINVSSAGTAAWEGEPGSYCAVEALREHTIDSGNHRARRLTEQMVDISDLILCMTRLQKRNIITMYPRFADKVFTFYEYAYSVDNQENFADREVSDPYGMPIETYRKCIKEIKDLSEKVFENISSESRE